MNAEEEKKKSNPKTALAVKEYQKYLEDMGVVGVRIESAGEFDDFDYFVFIDDKLDHFLEVKVRNCGLKDYADTMMPLRKHTFARFMKQKYHRNTYFLGVFKDALAIINIAEDPTRVDYRLGRYDRGNYKQYWVYYDTNRFEIIGKEV